MSLASILSTAMQGLQAQTTRLSVAADNVANVSSTGYAPQSVRMSAQSPEGVVADVTDRASEEPDPQTDMLNMIESSASFARNADAFDTGADLWDVVVKIAR